MNTITPIQFTEFVYRYINPNKYSWYYWYKLFCNNRNEFSIAGIICSTIVLSTLTEKIFEMLYKSKIG